MVKMVARARDLSDHSQERNGRVMAPSLSAVVKERQEGVKDVMLPSSTTSIPLWFSMIT